MSNLYIIELLGHEPRSDLILLSVSFYLVLYQPAFLFYFLAFSLLYLAHGDGQKKVKRLDNL